MIGLSTSLVKGGMTGRTYVKDGLKLYMPYRGSDASEVKFVGTGSTSFNGSSDYIDLDAHVGDFSSLTTGTISAWFKTSTPGLWQEILAASDTDDAASDITFGIKNNNKVFFWIRENGSILCVVYSASTYTDGLWHHAVITQDDTTLKMYVDGVLQTDTDFSSKWFSDGNNLNTLRIGIREDSSGNEYPFKGNIKNVAIWNRALTATEIQNVMYKTYAEVSGRLASGLVSWWALDADSLGTELITDGALDDTNNWNDGGGADHPTIGGGIATYTQGGNISGTAANRFDVVSGATYQVSFEILTNNNTGLDGLAGFIQHMDGSTSDVYGSRYTTVGVHTFNLVAAATVSTAHLLIGANDNQFDGTIDNVSFKAN